MNLQFLVMLAEAAIGQPFQHGSWVLHMQSYTIPMGDKIPGVKEHPLPPPQLYFLMWSLERTK